MTAPGSPAHELVDVPRGTVEIASSSSVARAWLRVATLAYLGIICVAVVLWVIHVRALPSDWWGNDFRYYQNLGARWLADGSYFYPHQLAGPYEFTNGVDVLYPPLALALLVSAVVLPWVVWWAVPLAILGYMFLRWRPTWPALAVIAVLLAMPRSVDIIAVGSTDLHATAVIAAALLWSWPAVLILFKPTLGILLLIGIRRRSWWVALAGVVIVSIPMIPLWLDYVTAMRNLSGLGLEHTLRSVPLFLVPVVAWAARRRSADEPERHLG